MTDRFSVICVALRIEQGGRIREVELAGAFDEVRSADQARAVARQLGDLLAENLTRRLQHGESLAA